VLDLAESADLLRLPVEAVRALAAAGYLKAGGEYRVWAEVANRRERGHWLLRPGLEARMTIGR
jgi:hypothetical protein